MSSSKPYTLRWGIIATGGISTKFTEDLFKDPTDRNATDVHHVVTAVGSRSTESAKAFIERTIPSAFQKDVKPCSSYAEVYADPNVDACYIGTPHTYHYENTKDALNAGRHVLCEKPFTFDLPELEELLALAKSKNLFLMEAVWTRFHPIAYEVQDLVFSGKYGKLKRIIGDFSSDVNPDERPENDRMIDPKLGGGALLDLGPYPMVWTMLMMHQYPANEGRPPSKVTGHMTLWKNGVDESSAWIIDWKNIGQAILSSSIVINMSKEESVIIQMEKADIHIAYPPYRPESYKIYPKTEDKPHPEPTFHKAPIPASQGNGMNYEADEVARCIRDGKIESERCNWAESRIVMSVFDQVREQGGYIVKHGKATK